ncbi:MAG: hypothetical protein H6740_00850 [Alphaproteobacteria bacterium]|nr:hypothetical protein [Alphaproteobacteria bacterium]
MHEQVLKLQALWRKEQARNALLDERSGLEQKLSRAGTTREEAEATLTERQARLVQLREDERAHTKRMETYIKHRDRAQEAIDTGTAPDYRIAQTQVERCAAIVDEEETFLLELFEEIEAAEAAVQGAINARDAAALRAREAQGALDARLPGLEAELVEATAERDAAREGIYRPELERYGRLVGRSLEPFADIRDSTCLGCNMKVNAVDLSEHRRAAAVVSCRHCGRFLGELL